MQKKMASLQLTAWQHKYLIHILPKGLQPPLSPSLYHGTP